MKNTFTFILNNAEKTTSAFVFSSSLIIGVLILINLFSCQFSSDSNLVKKAKFPISQASKNIVSKLKEPITISAYFSSNQHQQIDKIHTHFESMFFEYARLSNGMINFKIIDPTTEEKQQEAIENGIQPLMINVRKKDQSSQQRIFSGVILQTEEKKEVLPALISDIGLEYTLSTAIKKLTIIEKPSIGLVQGHGEPALSDLQQIYQSLSTLYTLENINLEVITTIPNRFRAVAIIAPKDLIPPNQIAKLEAYYNTGGKIMLNLNRVNGDLQTKHGITITTGLENWLQNKGVEIENSFLVDATCGSIAVQQGQGTNLRNTSVDFPFFPLISKFSDHPITTALAQIIMPFASPIRYTGDNSTTFTPIAFSSNKSASIKPPIDFNMEKNWTTVDFTSANLVVGGLLENKTTGSKLVIFGDGDFATAGQLSDQQTDNSNLLVNSINWLSDDTNLFTLRNKRVGLKSTTN